MTAPPLAAAAELVVEATQRAHLRGDDDAADRLDRLRRAVEHEAEYDRNVTLGAQIVRRRTDAPPGATIGWYFRNDPAVRAARKARGLRVQYGKGST